MLNADWMSLLVGTVLGTLSGLGIGGGSLLILWLTAVMGMDQLSARNLNLLFFLPAAAVSCWYRRKQGVLNIKQVFPGIAGGSFGAILGTHLSTVIECEILKKGFGLLLLATGFRELFYRAKKKTSR